MHEALRRPAAAPAAPTTATSAHQAAPFAAPPTPAPEEAAEACARALQRKPLFRLDQVVADPAPATPTPPPGRPLHAARDTAPSEMVARFRRRFQTPDAGPVQTRSPADGLASGLEAMAHWDIARIAAERAAAPRPAPALHPGDAPLQAKFTFHAPADDGNGFKDALTDYESSQTDFTAENAPKGVSGRFHNVTADKNLPTFYGVLNKLFGADNVNHVAFTSLGSYVGQTCDRPHKVSAKGWYHPREMRDGAPFVTGIGLLGNDQIALQEGNVTKTYHGGHLVGYQVLGGTDADQEWNVAPQEAGNNQFAYNKTIENMVRTITATTTFDYEVTLRYRSLNIEVDQGQLVHHGMIKALDPSKPWKLQLPNRIPVEWKTKATKTTLGGSFGTPAADPESRTYSQLVDALPDNPIAADAAEKAAFTLTMTGADASVIDTSADYKAGDVQTVTFHAKQYVPVNKHVGDKPADFAGADAADFGSTDPHVDVKEDITQDDLTALQDRIIAIEDADDVAAPARSMFAEVETAFSGLQPRALIDYVGVLQEEEAVIAADIGLQAAQDDEFKQVQSLRQRVTAKRKAIDMPADTDAAAQQVAFAKFSAVYEQAQILAATEASYRDLETQRGKNKKRLKLDAKSAEPVVLDRNMERLAVQMFNLPRNWKSQISDLQMTEMLQALNAYLSSRGHR